MKQEINEVKLTVTPTPQEQPAVQEEVQTAEPAAVEETEQDETPVEETAHTHRNTLETIVQEDAHESEVQPPSSFSLNKTLGGAILARALQDQIRLLLLVFLFLIIYITCRYKCQQQLVEIDRLEQQLITIRYKATVYTSELTEKSRESNIMDMLEQKGDSTLKVPTEPPYKINIPE